jgi:drug/metabolite transporter (DMT)-like permease
VAWGFYSLIGRGSRDPLRDTAGNFARASLVAVAAGVLALALRDHMPFPWPDGGLLTIREAPATPAGYGLAIASGAITSALGYVIWYAALKGLTATRAALVQTSVPVLSALGGIAILGERASWRLAASGTLILAGILLTLVPRRNR